MQDYKGWISLAHQPACMYCKSRFQEGHFSASCVTLVLPTCFSLFYEDSFRSVAEDCWPQFTFTALSFFCLLTWISNVSLFNAVYFIWTKNWKEKCYFFFWIVSLLWKVKVENAKLQEAQKNWCQFSPWFFSLFYFFPLRFESC